MAEMVVSAFFTFFFNTLTSEAMKKIVRAKGIESELNKLKALLIHINNLLYDASQKELTNRAVKQWLNGLNHLAYDIDDVFDELATEALTEKFESTISNKVRDLILTCCTNFSLSFRIHGKLDGIATKLQELVDEQHDLGLREITNGNMPKVKRYEASLEGGNVIVGREGDKEALLQKLLGGKDGSSSSNQNYSIVPIVGLGGVGKTTLARLLYNEKQVKNRFKVRAWVCVSDEFDVSSICNVIYQSVTGETKEFKDLNLLQEALMEKLRNKLFLIVLDDVWSESYYDWEKLVSPFLVGAPGSRIIMTTRKDQLLTKLGYANVASLSTLSDDDAMCLFSQHAGVSNFDSRPTLRSYAEGFVKKCDGLPLALESLGRLLRTREDEKEWKELLDSEIWRLGKKDEVLPVLRLSYNDLSASLKLLFAYCSLFPKDYVFNKEELVLLWMAEGFLHESTTSKSMERLGLEYFEELLSRSFFQHSSDEKSLFVMHDLMNDLAMSVAEDFFSRLDIGKKKEALQKHRHMSFVCERHMVQERFKPLEGAASLRTFLALSVGEVKIWERSLLSNNVLNNLLQELPLLRVLSLSNLVISEVPEVVGDMKHLRYLNLSNTNIKHLPENVCNLYNLQTLIVSGCEQLIKLPKSFSKLQNLKHFDLRGTTRLENTPLGICELKSLRILGKIIVGGENVFAVTELKNMQKLHGEVSILRLSNVQNTDDAREANLSGKRLSVLELDWGYGSSGQETNEKEILNELKPQSDNLKQLKINSYRGIEFPNWVGDPSFLQLAKLSLDNCQECTSLPPLGKLPSLKELFISDMPKVEVVGLEFLGTDIAFPSLQILRFENMKGWQVWSTTTEATFSCLKELRVKNCKNLVDVSLKPLPSLRILEVDECGAGVLMSLVTVASSLTKLEIKCISVLSDELWRSGIEYLGAVEELNIKSCNEIRYLWESKAASKVLVNLKGLDVENCNSLEQCSIPDNIETLWIAHCDSVTSISFPTGGGQKLKFFDIKNCKKIAMHKEEEIGVLINSSIMQCWPNLKSFIHLTHLMISECPSMESFPDHELSNLTSLINMTIARCTSMDDSFPRRLWPPKLCWLGIGGLRKPISEWGQQNFPPSLTGLVLCGPYDDVRNLDQLSHLFPSSLTILFIDGFEKLESISVGLQHLTSLQHLGIMNCPNSTDLPKMLLPSLLSLRIHGCPNLEEKSSRGGPYWSDVSLIPCLNIDDA